MPGKKGGRGVFILVGPAYFQIDVRPVGNQEVRQFKKLHVQRQGQRAGIIPPDALPLVIHVRPGADESADFGKLRLCSLFRQLVILPLAVDGDRGGCALPSGPVILQLVQVFIQFQPLLLPGGAVGGRVHGQRSLFGNQAQGAFRRAVPLPGRLGKPEFGLGGTALDAVSFQEAEAQTVLGFRIPFLCFQVDAPPFFRGDGADGGRTAEEDGG